jgi:HK97 gp10 family phage protein
MPEFDDQVSQFLKQVKRLVPDQETKRQMTKTGAQFLSKKLADETRAKHYDERHNVPKKQRGRVKHLADSVDYVDTNLDGVSDGTATVGFKGRQTTGVNHARIARFLNDGTKKMHGDHFVEHNREDNANEMFHKMSDVYHKSVKEGDK